MSSALDDHGAMPIDLPHDYEEFKAVVLAYQAEDDQGVYEVWWAANSRYPDLPLSTRLAVAEQVVRELVRDGRVRLVHGRWRGPGHHRKPVADLEAALRNWTTWIPEDEDMPWMTTLDDLRD